MSDPVSALPGATFTGAVEVREAGLRGMITLRGDLASDAVKNAATGVTGTDMPGTREVTQVGNQGIAWMSPDELLVMVEYDAVAAALQTMGAALEDTHHLLADVSDARAVFVLKGKGVREVLAKGSPADLGSLKPGIIRRSRLGQVAVAFWFSGEDEVTLVCFRSVARFVMDWLRVAAAKDSLPGYL